ncbi:MAG TPA: cyclase family protein [Acidimicrobiales bacterium]|nr:cyclase family protein [Acidimicrobiales bacterium]
MPAKTNWGRFGTDDERGMLNLLTPEVVLQATRVPKTGKVYSLALPIQRAGIPYFDYRGAPTRLPLAHNSDRGQFVQYGAPDHIGANEDVLILASHNETHMDALSHVFAERQMYNGVPAEAVSAQAGATRLGIEKVGWIVGRAVLLDMVRFYGVDRWLTGATAIDGDDLEACARQQGVEVHDRDIVLVRTGWIDWFLSQDIHGPADFAMSDFAQPGLSTDAAGFVDAHDITAIGADNSAIEVLGREGDVFLGGHVELLVNRGVHLIEHLMLKEMADDECYECLFVVAPLPVVGAAGSPVNPIAIA